jgi:NADH-quinone oxidoreductase subunit L
MHGGNHFEHYLAPVFESNAPHVTPAANPAESQGPSELTLTLAASGAGVIGFLLAWFVYHRRRDLAPRLRDRFKGAYAVLENKYFVDEFYGEAIVRPLVGLSRTVLWKFVDAGLIDGTVNSSAEAMRDVGGGVRQMQSGNIRSYAGWVALGAACVVAYMVWLGVR